MIWSLYLDVYRSGLAVIPGDSLDGDTHYALLSRRDPEEPLSFETGGYYFNPLFKDGGSLHPYVMNGEGHLGSVWTGKGPKKYNKEKAAMYDRGWFELRPRQIELGDIHPDLTALLMHQPKLYGAIAQVARSTMNLRIPEGLNIVNYEGWLAWIAAQRTPLPMRVKNAFQVLMVQPNRLSFGDKDSHYLLTGEMPEPVMQVKIRWYKYDEVRIIRRQIRESPDWELTVPKSVIDAGEEAILAMADAKFGPGWRDLADSLPSGITDRVVEGAEENVIDGPLIWSRASGGPDLPFVPLGEKYTGERPTSINDLFQIAIQST